MITALAHRGPDGTGFADFDQASIASCRLAVIDLVTGAQPIANESEDLWVVYNGEIYNHVQLREELVRLGHEFKTQSDTEVVVHGFEQWGDALFARLEGIFAFALYDSESNTGYLVRDWIGVKPLFYSRQRVGLMFASELKGLLAPRIIEPRLNYSSVRSYLMQSYPNSIDCLLEGISQVPPGHFLRWFRGAFILRRYCAIRLPRALLPASAAVIEFPKRLVAHVESNLLSDVPVGIFLSGGLDSSSIAWAARQVSDHVKTFTVGFHVGENELGEARAIANHLGTDHTELTMESPPFSRFEEMIRVTDAPLTDLAVIPLMDLTRVAKRQVKVVLTGEGGDEAFCGYRRYLNRSTWASRATLIPRSIRRLTGNAISRVNPESRRARGLLYIGSKASLPITDGDAAECYLPWELARLAVKTAGARSFANRSQILEGARGQSMDMLTRQQVDDMSSLLPFCFLPKTDLATMAHGVEARVPLLDQHLVVWALSISPEDRVEGSSGKKIIRAAMKGRLPESTIAGKKKGFGVPASIWLSDWRPEVEDLISRGSARLRGILDPWQVQKTEARAFARRSEISATRLLAIAGFVLWSEYVGV